MSFRLDLPPTFADRVAGLAPGGHLAGMWVTSGSPVAAEIAASSGLDWVLLDAEHSPLGLETTTRLLQAMNGYPATPVVRVPVNDTVLIKQHLDLGAQNLLVPMVDTVADAVGDCPQVFATTVRKRGVTKPVVTPEEAAREIHAAQGR